jgi:hypothetical protein
MLAKGRPVMRQSYERLKAAVIKLREQGVDLTLSVEERANWAYGTTKIENDDVTEAMALDAARRITAPR